MTTKKSASLLPPRRYYRLTQAAESLKCTVDDLLHWGANNYAELCLKPEFACTSSAYRPIPFNGETPTEAWSGINSEHEDDITSIFTLDTDEEEGYKLLGLWRLDQASLVQLEHTGRLEGEIRLFMADAEQEITEHTPIEGMIVYAELKNEITPADLYLTHREVARIRSGKRRSQMISFPFDLGSGYVPLITHEPADSTSHRDLRQQNTDLNIIGALLEVIDGKLPGVEKHPSITSQSDLISHLEKQYEGIRGLSKRTLEARFPAARRSIEQS